MSDEVFIYLIVALNIFVQLMLINRLRFPPDGRRKYYLLAVAIPVAIMLSMRLLIVAGAIPRRVADQSAIEQFTTNAAGVILMAAPWLVTLFAIVDRKRRAWVKKLRSESDEPL
jgi:hypothetical protein